MECVFGMLFVSIAVAWFVEKRDKKKKKVNIQYVILEHKNDK